MKTKNGLKRISMAKENDLPYDELFERFLKKCKVNNLSEYTIESYQVANRLLNKFVSTLELNTSDISKDLIDDYILYLQDKGLKPISVNTYIHGIAPCIKFGMDLGLIKRFKFKDIKTTETIKEVYTDEELQILLQKPSMQSFAEYRNWVIINFLLGTGVRALEMRNIKVDDVDLQASMLIVKRTKNKKQRYVPISKRLNEILLEYIEVRKPSGREDYLFCNEFGEYMPRTTLQMAITKYAKRKGLTKYSIHLFRHTFAKKWIVNGGDIFSLQKILGHSNLRMVQHYSNLYTEDLQKNYDRFCALEQVVLNYRQRINI